MSRGVSTRSALGLLAFVVSASVAACGGETPASRMPQGTTVQTPPTGGPGVAANPQGQQFAMTDQPTSGASASNRPKMNASALQAYNAGLAAFQSGDLQGAKAQFSTATQADGNAYQAFYSLGVVEQRLAENGSALTAFRKAVSVVSDYEPAIAAYALLLASTGKTSEADSYLSDYQGKMPKSAAVTAALAEVKSIEGNSADAQRLAQEALKKNPDYRPAMVTLARDFYRTGKLDLALYTLKGILDGFGAENPPRDKDNASAHMLRGLIYKKQAQRKAAIDEFHEALKLRPDLVEARVQLATYLLESGNATEAAPLLEGALRYDKDNLLAHLNLGDAYRLLGKTAEAMKELNGVLAKDSTVAQAHYNLGLLYLFSESVPGLTPTQAADKAIDELTTYQKMKPRATAGGAPDDTDELITRAKTKKALIEAKAAEKTQPPPPPPAAPAPAGKGTPPAAAPAGGDKGGSTGSLPPATGGSK